jgi:hypothetical protein
MTALHAHLQGVMKALNVNKLTRCGVTFKFWCASRPAYPPPSTCAGSLKMANPPPQVTADHEAHKSLACVHAVDIQH